MKGRARTAAGTRAAPPPPGPGPEPGPSAGGATLRALAAPLAVELLLGMAVGLAGTLLAARSSDASGAAFALAHHVFGAVFILFRVVGAGVGVVVAQALGAGRRERADAAALTALAAATWLGAALALLTLAAGTPLLRALNAPPSVLPLAAPLLAALAPAMLLDAWIATQSAVLRAHLAARPVLAVTAAMHLVHLGAMGPLMHGVGPWPGLGLAGFALALLLARAVALALYLALWRERLGVRPRLRDLWRPSAAELRPMAHIGLPAAAEQAAYRIAFVASVAVVGALGAQALAAHAYAQQVIMVVLLPGLATGLAVEVLAGRCIGAGRLRAADRLVRRALARGLALSLAVALAAALFGPALLGAFSSDRAIVASAALMLWWTVLLEPGRTFNLVLVNALRAAGDARYPVAVGALSMALVLAGGSWLLGWVLGLGLSGVWIAYVADEWLRGLLMWRRWRRLDWVPHARASRRRLARGAPARQA